ncbi:MAG TPA: amidase family protein [Acidimicrobiales bacterium]|jgi:aspartyl-tRNA(Asn)/glutamyl-tRNA(Gln) amidotransferase subunit A|nr:amidase family protein [Acidimicrobiales bacterium]
MIDRPWTGDACSLVDAFRAGELSPLEALDASFEAVDQSGLNAFSHLDVDAARARAGSVDVSLPFGGVPMGIKELETVEGWPYTEASLVFKDRVADHDSSHVARLRAAGAVLAGQTAASEFGGINCTHTKLHGTTRNPWDPERTPGGSSGGSAAAVSGGLLPVASGGDGGGSIRIPAGFTGLFGLKSTFGRIPKGPRALQPPLTVVLGCVSRSVRDTARWFDVCNGFDPRDTLSLPRVGGWEDGLDSFDLAGKRAVVSINLGSAIVEPRVAALTLEAAEALIAAARLTRVDVAVQFPPVGLEWAMSNMVGLVGALGDRYPECNDDLMPEIQLGMNIATHNFNVQTAGSAEMLRIDVNEQMADLFEQTDFILAATNPDVAFRAEGPMPTTVGEVDLVAEYGLNTALGNNGALTIPANLTGSPAVSIPAGTVDGLPVGLQVIGRHHEEQLLLDLARVAERERPWPLVVPGAPS